MPALDAFQQDIDRREYEQELQRAEEKRANDRITTNPQANDDRENQGKDMVDSILARYKPRPRPGGRRRTLRRRRSTLRRKRYLKTQKRKKASKV
jgi:hypothetical protein